MTTGMSSFFSFIFLSPSIVGQRGQHCESPQSCRHAHSRGGHCDVASLATPALGRQIHRISSATTGDPVTTTRSSHACHRGDTSTPGPFCSEGLGRRDSLSSFRPLPQGRSSRPTAVEPQARPSSAKRETTPFAWRYVHSPAYTCIHVHFRDFTCVQLRSFLLISLQPVSYTHLTLPTN